MSNSGYKVAHNCNGLNRLILLSSLLLWAACAVASPVTVVLQSFDGPYVNGIPTYPYTLGFAATLPFLAMCNDYYHGGAPGDVWLANLNNMAALDMTAVRFSSSGLSAYQQAAWILLQTEATPPQQWADINFAVWHVFNPTVPIDAQAQHWIDLSVANYKGVDYRKVYVATPMQIEAPPAADQEFIFIWNYPSPPGTINPLESPVPEPGSLVLLGTGAMGIFAAMRKQRSN